MKHLISILLFFSMFGPLSGQAQEFVIDQLQKEYNLNGHLLILPTDDDQSSLPALQNADWQGKSIFLKDWMKENEQQKFPAKLSADETYWCKLNIENRLPHNCPIEDWILFIGMTNSTEVWLIDSLGNEIDHRWSGSDIPNKLKDFPIGNRRFDRVLVSLPALASTTLYFKITTIDQRAPKLSVKLGQADFYQNLSYLNKTRLDWAFIGVLLAFILLSYLMFAATRDKVFMYHALFQTGVFIYLLEYFNFLHDLPFFRDHFMVAQCVIYFCLCGLDISYLQFVRSYMGLGRLSARWDGIAKKMIWARLVFYLATTIVFVTYLKMRWTDSATGLYMIIQYVFIAGLMLYYFKKEKKQHLFIVAGTMVFSLGIVLNAFSVVQGEGLQFGFTQFGVLGEVLLFTLGLGYRMKLLQDEKQEAHRLKDLNEFKARFFTNITHEFRTPLTVIQGMSEELIKLAKGPVVKKALSEAGANQYPQLIKRNGEQLLNLVNRMLDLAKLESGKMELNIHLSDVVAFLRYLTHSFQSFAAAKDIHVLFLTDLEKFEMDFDADRMQDVMTNLLSNAIKFSKPGGEITVLVKEKSSADYAGCLIIRVKDNGIGMSEEELRHIFERFYTGNEQKSSKQGTGIGLAVTHELVKLMGGTIDVSSQQGVGTEFTLMVPVSRKAQKYDTPPPDINVPVVLQEQDGYMSISSVIDENKPLALVVEDNADVAFFLKQMLQEEFQVATAYDGEAGIEKAFDLIPDVIVSDVLMPKKDGFELCHALKLDERTSHIPILLLTAKVTTDDRLFGLRQGADAYLSKPFNREELLAYLRNFISLRIQMQFRYAGQQLETPKIEETPIPAFLQMEDAFVTKMRSIVEDNMEDERFGTEHLSRKLGMSRSQLHRKVTALTGGSASQFMNSIRLEVAKKRLLTTHLTIAEIAYDVGMEPNYFSRFFKDEVGVTPTEFRKEG